jgi:hypothetical protein
LHTVVASAVIHAYVSQSDRGEIVIGGGADRYNSYAQRGALPTFQENAMAATELFPCFSRLRVMRQWAGICDIAPDASPIVGLTPLKNLYISTGWGTGGYKAIPAGGDTLAYTIVHDEPLICCDPFSLTGLTAAGSSTKQPLQAWLTECQVIRQEHAENPVPMVWHERSNRISLWRAIAHPASFRPREGQRQGVG